MRKLAPFLIGLSLVSSSAFAATPSQGVPLQVRRGFFTETDVGAFFTVGGDNGYSNGQAYVQLGVGYQLTINDGKGLIPIGFHVGIGSNAQNCWAGLKTDGTCSQSDNFTLTMLNLTGGYLHELVERFYLGGKLIGGVTLLDPRPIPDPDDAANTGLLLAPNAGVAFSIEYATNMDHFSIGLDITYRLVIGPNINALGAYLRVQYTF